MRTDEEIKHALGQIVQACHERNLNFVGAFMCSNEDYHVGFCGSEIKVRGLVATIAVTHEQKVSERCAP